MTLTNSLAGGLVTGLSSGLITSSGGGVAPAANPIDALDNIITDVDMRGTAPYTFSSGIIIDTIAARSGIDLGSVIGSPEYDSAAFGGQGGARIKAVAESIRQVSDFSADASQTVIFVTDIAASAVGTIISYATGTGNGSTVSRILYISDTSMQYRSEEASNVDILTSGVNGIHVIGLRYNSLTSLEVYIDSATPTTTSFNPNDDYAIRTRLRLGSRLNDAVDETAYGYLLQTSDVLTDTEMADCMTYLAGEFGVSI